ncbi:precorrin-6y C5,15-methyltransferase (decarboxylating) subunit CbiE [Alkalihalobacillus oceani]|uniref:Precorrin-6y C5,15-methyltransferase (Decarboxylating) subunit CbiE n=1 Tax=Halalkalibacter oceani TaxID=1653776 RepID=A0A9X2DNL3_9BACI|nr:precorrin-6y C5,15-methyltransferase (decarboxylating) subunit CbiE [Halalkalibacter oceani]MCM3713776.1 precorrin-6y C5,15-methyltransferase (decarboxylating) subunit CbiE [Halalkalibacter oceani]
MAATMKVIGMSEQGPAAWPALYQQWVDESERLVGGERQLAFFPGYQGEKIGLKGGLKATVERLLETDKKTVILASGDPLFYGIGGYLAKKVPKIELYPALSSIQAGFAKMQESWHDATFLSVHGRAMKGLAQKIDGQKKVCLLTDETNSPAAIAAYLLDYGMSEYKAFVAEALGGANEKTGWFELDELTRYEAHPLNLVILKQTGKAPSFPLGIDDHLFRQRKPDKGLITKKEVRTLSIAALKLTKTSTVWDIGTCTGSVAIEAARIATEGQVFAIEKNEADLANCYENMKTFRTDFTVVHGKAPAQLDSWPDPDAVFIGGTGGELPEIIRTCAERLKAGGRIVLNAVTVETLATAQTAFKEAGLALEMTLAQLSRSKPILHMTRFDALNPIYILTATKEETDGNR